MNFWLACLHALINSLFTLLLPLHSCIIPKHSIVVVVFFFFHIALLVQSTRTEFLLGFVIRSFFSCLWEYSSCSILNVSSSHYTLVVCVCVCCCVVRTIVTDVNTFKLETCISCRCRCCSNPPEAWFTWQILTHRTTKNWLLFFLSNGIVCVCVYRSLP